MANPLNLYATKVFSEHPLALWPLDDIADYVSLITNAQQNLSTWSATGVSSVVDANNPNVFSRTPPLAPHPEKNVNGIIATTDNNGLVTFTSPFSINPQNINAEQETFSIGVYVYSFEKIIDFRLGFRYTDPETLEVNEVIKAASFSTVLSWAFVSESFVLPENFSNLQVIFEIYYETDLSPYSFAVNGITVGQWAEEFQTKSFGVNLIDVPSDIPIPATKGIEAFPYGIPGNNGYYIANDNALAARNFGTPLVYGARSSTRITPKPNSPSLIVPGFGFMNRSGQFSRLTAEFWIKVDSFAILPRRIFGPISSEDGIYVEGPFLKLRIGELVASHFVGEWNRVMLIQIRLSPENADLIVNGEIVANLELDSKSYSFPASIVDSSRQDWLGFYAHEDVPFVSLDCVGVYPYEVAADLAKRRWIYGQAVQAPTGLKGLDSSSSIFVDYPFSKYAKNFYFPSSSNWSNGKIENLVVEKNDLKVPDYSLPEIRFTNQTLASWYKDMESYQDSADAKISLKPSSRWDNTDGHLYFENLNFLEEQTRSFYAVFESKRLTLDKAVLFEIKSSSKPEKIQVYYKGNPVTGSEEFPILTSQQGTTVVVSGQRHGLRTGANVFIGETGRIPNGNYQIFVISETEFSYQVAEIFAANVEEEIDEEIVYCYDATIFYSFFKPGVLSTGASSPQNVIEDIFYTATGHNVDKKFMAGIHLPRFVESKGEELANFFGTRQNISLFVGGTEELSYTFDGNIYTIGFANERNLRKISHLFNDFGIPVDYENVFDSFGLDVFDAGDEYFGNDPDYWDLALDGGDPFDFQSIKATEHIATYTVNPKLDAGAFRLDVGTEGYWADYVPLSYFSKETVDVFGKKQFRLDFVQINLDYPDIKRFDNFGKYDNSKNFVRAYVGFQYLRDSKNTIFDNFSNTERLGSDKVVFPQADWINTRYEIVDGAIVYPPPGVDIRGLSLNVYLEYQVDGIFSNPVKTRYVQIASQAFGSNPNSIGTKNGADLVPFRKSGQYFNYLSVAPFSIYKESTPYLYLTDTSGIEIKSSYKNNDFGISIPLNKDASPFFKLGSIQMSLKYGEKLFPEVPVKIFEIESANNYIKFFLVADSPSRTRGQLYAIDGNTNKLKGNLIFFNNGVAVKRPVFYANSWNVVAMSFPAFLDLGGPPSALRITSPIMFNNISFYQTSSADDEERFGFRQWFSVASFLGEPIEWGYWSGETLFGENVVPSGDQAFTWQEVLFLSTTVRQELNGERIYNIYTGTDRSIVESDQLFSIGKYQYKLYNGITWRQNSVNAV
jgi:hypothetical protein